MSIITRTRPEVKPTRHTAKPARPFGQGILPSRPVFSVPFTVADAAWAAQAIGDADADREFDAMALESAMLDRYTLGCYCF